MVPVEDDSDEDESDNDEIRERPDYDAIPTFHLSVFHGGNEYRQFAQMYVTPEKWEELKNMNVPLDDEIVECAKDERGRWIFKRFRSDKKDANHISTVNSVLESIEDGVSQEDLLRNAATMRTAWKEREAKARRPQ